MPVDERSGVIHDIGYQRYTGARLGRGYAVRCLYVHSLRSAFGLGRSVKAKVFPWFVLGILLFIAVLAVVLRSQTERVFISYLDFSRQTSLLSVLFVCSVAPDLLCRDLRSKVLPLYFSRPITRTDYALAKLAAAVTAVWLALAGPLLVMFVGSVLTLSHVDDAWFELLHFLGGVSLAVIYALVYAVIGTLVSSTLGRRMVAAAVIAGYFLLTSAVSGVVKVVAASDRARNIGVVISPASMVHGLRLWLFGDPGNAAGPGGYGPWYLVTTIAFVLAGTALLVARYRTVTA